MTQPPVDPFVLEITHALTGSTRLRLLNALCEDKSGLRPAQIAKKLGIGLPTVNHHLKALLAAELVVRLPVTKRCILYVANRDALKAYLFLLKRSWDL